MIPIAHIRSLFPTKFGIPRQSNIVSQLPATIVFEPEFRNPDALRGIEDFDYLWLIWQFSENLRSDWSPTVRPPRLGGNKRMGVFATRSPFRPNGIGLSSVRLTKVEWDTADGPVLHVSGADLMDGTPIFDIKPYIAYSDAHPDARSGFASVPGQYRLEVNAPESVMAIVPEELKAPLIEVLANDPRPSYHEDADRIYGVPFGPLEVKFNVKDGVLTIVAIDCLN